MSMDSAKQMLLEDSDSDDELDLTIAIVKAHELFHGEGGSKAYHDFIPRCVFIDRDTMQGHQRLFQDYFADSPVYPPKLFRRRFRMNRSLFFRILSAVEAYDPYFAQKKNCAGTIGLSSLQKMTAVLRMLAYGVATDYVDEYVRIGESTTIESLKHFVIAAVTIFSDTYLRSPNSNDVTKLLEVGEQCGFQGMLGSIDCMHWRWKNCPAGWKGQFSGHSRESTIILEAVASYDLWIWHAFFGLPGSHNDINILERSFIFSALAEGCAPPANYSINDHDYTVGYYLADGIYPRWSTFMKTISRLQGKKAKHFTAAQESVRKDVEHAFGVLQAHFTIVRGPARGWNRHTLKLIMKTCIILHNMIIEDERNSDDAIDFDYEQASDTPNVEVSRMRTVKFTEFIQRHLSIRDSETHSQLQLDLIENLWKLHGQN